MTTDQRNSQHVDYVKGLKMWKMELVGKSDAESREQLKKVDAELAKLGEGPRQSKTVRVYRNSTGGISPADVKEGIGKICEICMTRKAKARCTPVVDGPDGSVVRGTPMLLCKQCVAAQESGDNSHMQQLDQQPSVHYSNSPLLPKRMSVEISPKASDSLAQQAESLGLSRQTLGKLITRPVPRPRGTTAPPTVMATGEANVEAPEHQHVDADNREVELKHDTKPEQPKEKKEEQQQTDVTGGADLESSVVSTTEGLSGGSSTVKSHFSTIVPPEVSVAEDSARPETDSFQTESAGGKTSPQPASTEPDSTPPSASSLPKKKRPPPVHKPSAAKTVDQTALVTKSPPPATAAPAPADAGGVTSANADENSGGASPVAPSSPPVPTAGATTTTTTTTADVAVAAAPLAISSKPAPTHKPGSRRAPPPSVLSRINSNSGKKNPAPPSAVSPSDNVYGRLDNISVSSAVTASTPVSAAPKTTSDSYGPVPQEPPSEQYGKLIEPVKTVGQQDQYLKVVIGQESAPQVTPTGSGSALYGSTSAVVAPAYGAGPSKKIESDYSVAPPPATTGTVYTAYNAPPEKADDATTYGAAPPEKPVSSAGVYGKTEAEKSGNLTTYGAAPPEKSASSGGAVYGKTPAKLTGTTGAVYGQAPPEKPPTAEYGQAPPEAAITPQQQAKAPSTNTTEKKSSTPAKLAAATSPTPVSSSAPSKTKGDNVNPASKGSTIGIKKDARGIPVAAASRKCATCRSWLVAGKCKKCAQ